MEEITDENCNIIRDYVRTIKSEIPAERRAVLRFPGGMPARHYDIDKGGYGDPNYVYGSNGNKK
jgi:hypothetical protein